jgi:putative ABC transport system permease protein
MLGVRAELGRVFVPEDALPGRNDIILLSHGIWLRLFGGDPGIIGRTLEITNRPIRRLRPGVSLGAAQADLNRICRDVAREHGDTNPQAAAVRVEPLYEKMTAKIRIPFLVLLAAGGFVLLIACTNLPNLLLARATERTPEMGVRAALGCGRWRLAQQLLVESWLLSLAGGAAGVLLARPAIAALVAAACVPRGST